MAADTAVGPDPSGSRMCLGPKSPRMVDVIERASTVKQPGSLRSQVDAAARLSRAGVGRAREAVGVLEALAGGDTALFQGLVDRRCARIPLEHLTGVARYRQLDFLVGPGVFVPQPETGCVVQFAVARLRRLIAARERNPLCVDLCTGAGTIALSITAEVPEAVVHAVEIDATALGWAAHNKTHHRLSVTLHNSDVVAALPELNGRCDLVVSNPPYVATSEIASVRPEVRDHDPAVALAAGVDGLDIIRQIEATARRLLKPGGFVVVEHSDRQGRAAPGIFRASGAWTGVKDHQDHDLLDVYHRRKAVGVATVHQHIEASPAAVFELLADGWNYSQWVVGTSHVRSVDAKWPQPGSRLHHAAGAWPLVVRDHTEMRELEPNRRLLMTAKGWPFGEAEVEILLAPEDSGTDLTLREHGTGGAGRLLRNPIGDRLIHRRNVESVARLAALAERRTQPADDL